jgi:hypothetical protein
LAAKTVSQGFIYRLKVIRIQTTSLRDVPEDIPVVAKHFLCKFLSGDEHGAKTVHTKDTKLADATPLARQRTTVENEAKRLFASVRRKINKPRSTSMRRLETHTRPRNPQKYRWSLETCERPLNNWNAG